MSYKNKGVNSDRQEKGYYSDELKRRWVMAVSQPGASLSKVAQQQGVSVSALSKWCKQYRQPEAATLLPIAIQPAENPSAATETTDDSLAPQE
ncbi:MAG: transposase [Candidatus Symbiodolus clandestinus]